mgnify:CR=1
MRFVLLRPLPTACECRYDGPAPPLRRPAPAGSGLLDRLAAEACAQAARRRRQIGVAQVLADGALARHVRSLADYRRQAVTLRG